MNKWKHRISERTSKQTEIIKLCKWWRLTQAQVKVRAFLKDLQNLPLMTTDFQALYEVCGWQICVFIL